MQICQRKPTKISTMCQCSRIQSRHTKICAEQRLLDQGGCENAKRNEYAVAFVLSIRLLMDGPSTRSNGILGKRSEQMLSS